MAVRLSRPVALLVAGLTLAPWAYVVFFTTVLIPHLMSIAPQGGELPSSYRREFMLVFRIHFAMVALCLVLIGFYIWYLFKTDRVPSDKKSLWAVVLFLGNLIAMPVFWYLYMWPREDGAA